MYCKDCKHWTRNTSDFYDKRFGDCFSDKFEYDYSAQDYHSNDKLIYWDYEGYKAGFTTGENFGCVHFEKKSKEN